MPSRLGRFLVNHHYRHRLSQFVGLSKELRHRALGSWASGKLSKADVEGTLQPDLKSAMVLDRA